MTKHPITVILGLPGAGKSTYSRTVVPADDLKTIRINLDDIRLMFGVAFDECLEQLVWDIAFNIASTALYEGCSVVFDESITDPKWMQELTYFARDHRVPVHAVVVQSPSYLCWKKREATSFPRYAFERKLMEWTLHRETILGLCDSIETRTGNTEMMDDIRRKCTTAIKTK